MQRVLAGVAAVVLLTACGGGPGQTSSNSPSPTASSSPTPTRLPTASPPPYVGPTSAGDYAGWELSPDGFGSIRLGLGAAEGRERGWVTRLPHCDRWGSSPDLIAEGVDLVFDDADRLTEIWLGSPVHVTTDGARVGMAMEEVAYLYSDRLDVQERTSLGGRQLVAFVADDEHELLFYAIGDKDEIPGPRSPVTAIGARALDGDITRPSC